MEGSGVSQPERSACGSLVWRDRWGVAAGWGPWRLPPLKVETWCPCLGSCELIELPCARLWLNSWARGEDPLLDTPSSSRTDKVAPMSRDSVLHLAVSCPWIAGQSRFPGARLQNYKRHSLRSSVLTQQRMSQEWRKTRDKWPLNDTNIINYMYLSLHILERRSHRFRPP